MMKKFYLIILSFILCLSFSVFAQENVTLPSDLRNQLQNQQQNYYQNYLTVVGLDKPFITDNIEYAMVEAQLGNQLAEKMAKSAIDQQLNLISQTPPNNQSTPSDINQFVVQTAISIKFFSYAYALWHNPRYLVAAQALDNKLMGFLKLPDCLYVTTVQLNSQLQQLYPSSKFIDKNSYTRQIGLVSNAVSYLYMVTGNKKYLDQATNIMQWVINNRNLSNSSFCNDILNSGNLYLSNNLALGKSLLSLYQASSDRNYLTLAQQKLLFINQNFNTPKNIGFFEKNKSAKNNVVNNNIDRDDNAQLARFANLLYYYTGNEMDKNIANQAMLYLIQPDNAKQLPVATVLLADKEISQQPLHLTIVGSKNDVQAQQLYAASLAYPSLYKRIEWYDKDEGPLPNNDIKYPDISKAAVFICTQQRCSLPLLNPAEIPTAINEITHYKPLWNETSYNAINQETIANHQNILNTFNKNLPSNPNILNFTQSTHPLSAQEKATLLLKNNNWFLIVPAFFVFGLLLAFTPCVLPMVPILVSIIAGQGKTLTTRKAFLLSLTYVLTMSVTYACAGVLAGYAGSYVQAFLQNAWVLIVFSVIFVLLALSLFGFYELRMPNVWHTKLHEFSNKHEGGTYFGVAMMGFFATLIVSPCVTAPLIGVLSYIGNTGNMLVGGVALFVMGLGMGLPLIIVGTGGGKFLPKSGSWLHIIKVFLGLLLLCVSIWMLSRIVSDAISIILVSILVVGTAVYTSTLAIKNRGKYSKIWQAISIIFFIYGLALFIGVLMGNASLFQPLKMKQISVDHHQAITKISFNYVKNMADLQTKLADAKSQHKPVFLDFYADWCVSCKMMDRFVLTDPKVIDLLQNFVILRVDMTANSADDIAIAKHFNMIGPPVVIFFDENGQQVQPAIVGEVTTHVLTQRLQQLTSSLIQ